MDLTSNICTTSIIFAICLLFTGMFLYIRINVNIFSRHTAFFLWCLCVVYVNTTRRPTFVMYARKAGVGIQWANNDYTIQQEEKLLFVKHD